MRKGLKNNIVYIAKSFLCLTFCLAAMVLWLTIVLKIGNL